jgi:hypothetical protein
MTVNTGAMRRYLSVLGQLRAERGEFCEACASAGKMVPARHGHHIIRVSETNIHSELVYEPANIIILCDDCHALMHPLLRNISEWKIARSDRGRAIHRS